MEIIPIIVGSFYTKTEIERGF